MDDTYCLIVCRLIKYTMAKAMAFDDVIIYEIVFRVLIKKTDRHSQNFWHFENYLKGSLKRVSSWAKFSFTMKTH